MIFNIDHITDLYANLFLSYEQYLSILQENLNHHLQTVPELNAFDLLITTGNRWGWQPAAQLMVLVVINHVPSAHTIVWLYHLCPKVIA